MSKSVISTSPEALLTKRENTTQCNAMQCNAMQCNAMQCNTIQYNTMGKTHMYVCMLIRQVEAGNEPRRDKIQTFLS